MAGQATPFTIHVADEEIEDLKRRLATRRMPAPFASVGSSYGMDLEVLPAFLDYWQNGYDWRAQERQLNALPNFQTEIDGQRLHFVHSRSSHENALPLVLSHGWPGSIVEFLKVFEPLSQPERHGGSSEDAFHVVAPSLPGFVLSGPTHVPGWSPQRMGEAFHQLMSQLGYRRYGVQGGDWGSLISTAMGSSHPESICGVHTNLPLGAPPDPDNPTAGLSESELADLAGIEPYMQTEMGYFNEQSTKPHTLGVGLGDSPAGLAAWILEKFTTWSDCGGKLESVYTKDELLTNVSLYWFTGTATSAARIYYEFAQTGGLSGEIPRVAVPTGVARFPKELAGFLFPRSWCEQIYNVTHWTAMPRGGHFAAMEQPELFVDDVRSFFRTVR